MTISHSNPSKKYLILEIAGVILIAIMAAFLRYPNLEVNPGWYSDEGMLIDVANHLNQGEQQYMAIKDSLLLFGRPPLFVNLLALIFRYFEPGILTLRVLTATLGILTIVMLYLMVRICLGRKGIPLAFLSAIMLTISPMGVLYSRMGYSYSFLSPLVLLTMLSAWKYAFSGNRWWLVAASLLIGIGSLSDIMMFTIFVPLAILVLIRRWRDIFMTLGLVLIPFTIYIIVMLIIEPQAFLFDLKYTFLRVQGFSLLEYIPVWLFNYGLILKHDYWVFPALVGMVLIKPVRFGQFVILFWAVPLVILARSFLVAGLGYYYTSPLISLIALGVAALIIYGTSKLFDLTGDAVRFLYKRYSKKPGTILTKNCDRVIKFVNAFVIIFVVIVPIGFNYIYTIAQVQDYFSSSLDPFVIDPASGKAVAEYVNNTTDPDELVIASPALAWTLDCHTAEFQMALAIDGIETLHLPIGIDQSRFAYDTRLTTARYVILDPIWENFGIPSMPEVADMADTVRTEWNLVFEDGDIQVYENPVRHE
jgi:hypothetical protein